MEIVVGEGGTPLATAAGQATGNASAAATKTNLDTLVAANKPVSSVGAADATSLSTTNATQLPSQAASIGVLVSCPTANTAPVYIGDSTVTTANGIELNPGDRHFFVVANANLLYARTGTATQSVRSMAF